MDITANPNHEMGLASQGRRLAAAVLDVIIFVITFVVGWLIWFAFTARKGQTPAKQILKLHVVQDDGSAVSPWRMLLREILIKMAFFYLLFFLLPGEVGLLPVVLYLLAASWCIWDSYRQCLWDKVTKTWVVHVPGAMQSVVPAPPSADVSQTLEELHARGILTDKEYEERKSELGRPAP
tara:strand:- start:879 stop:1418 length:540 start_codon:yes stop_codon:yes gene_type:complete